MEARYPLRVRSYRLDREAGGIGRHRGGPGTVRVLEVLTDIDYAAMPDPTQPPSGLAGGAPGKLGRVTIRLPGETEWHDPPRTRNEKRLPAGALIRHESGGGGGWGTPHPNTDDTNASS